jgi:hypothetical protein
MPTISETKQVEVTSTPRRTEGYAPSFFGELPILTRAISHEYTNVEVKVDGKTAWSKDVHPVFDIVSLMSGGQVEVPKPFYSARIRKARKRANKNAARYRK